MDFGIGGTTSTIGQELFIEKLVWPEYVKSRVLDLVILDYGVNDACEMWDGRDIAAVSSVEHGLERLVRKILTLYTVDGKQPNIVLINGMPSFHAGYQYTRVYSKVAEHYSLPLWSYNDVVMSDEMKKRSYSYILRWRDTCKECGDVHPAWYVHLFMADLYSAIIEKEFRKCSLISPSKNELVIPYKLPPALNTDGVLHRCDSKVPTVLRVTVGGVVNHEEQIGKFLSQSVPSHWQVVEEKGGKLGWIDEFPDDYNPTATNNQERVLSFELIAPPSNNFYQHQGELLLRVIILRTYKNAGKFEVFLCGELIGVAVDTCWANPSKRVSTTDVHSIVIPGFPASCTSKNLNNSSPLLQLKHIWAHGVGLNSTCIRTERQKVKVMEVILCATGLPL